MTTDIDLSKFCSRDDDEVRLWMTRPWRRDGKIYATQGHVLIAIDDDGREGVDDYAAGRHPHAHKMVVPVAGAEFVTMPDIGPITAPCKRCGGAGKHGRIQCESCDGKSWFEHSGQTYSCAACEGGFIGSDESPSHCQACQGFGESGWLMDCDKTDIGDARFQSRYLRLFVGLPNVQIAVGGEKDRAVIRFDGGMGAVMPMRKE